MTEGTTAQPTEGTGGVTQGQTSSGSTDASSSGSSSGTAGVLSTGSTGSSSSTSSSTGDSTTGNDTDCGGGGVVEFSHIWISNSPEGTVSKIDSLIAANSGEYGGIWRVG